MVQSVVLCEIKAEIPLQKENPLIHQIQWQQYIERIESLSSESKVSRFCLQDLCVLLKLDNISWPKTLVILDNFVQWLVVNTLSLETIHLHNQKDGFKETWELGLYWKSQPVKNFKYGIEIRIWSVGQDNSQSWVRISYGTIKYVVDSNQNKYRSSCRSTRRPSVTKQVSQLLQPD